MLPTLREILATDIDDINANVLRSKNCDVVIFRNLEPV